LTVTKPCNRLCLSAVIEQQPMEASMKNSRYLLAAGVAAVFILHAVSTFAQDEPKRSINPGLVPNTGQINTGEEPNPGSSSPDIRISTPDEAWSALVEPISRQPSAGSPPPTTTGASGQQPSAPATAGASGEPPPSGPIGSFGQTIPAKFSKRNDILDHVPVVATPLPLTAEQRKQIYDAVMAEKSQPVAGAEALKPADELSPEQALTGMQPLPDSVRGIDGVSRLYYIKSKDKVLLIEPNVRTVVGEIKAS
jgi:hypothetical protein